MSKQSNTAAAKKKKRRTRVRVGRIVVLFFGVLLVAALVGGAAFVVDLLKGNDIYEGVHVGIVDVSGMNRRKAIDAVTAVYGGSAARQDLVIRIGDKNFTLSAEECPITYDLERSVTNACQYGRTGSIFTRIADVWRAKEEGAKVEMPVEVNDVTLLKQMEAISQSVKVDYRPSGYTYENGELLVDKGLAGYGVDATKLTEAVRSHLISGELGVVELALGIEQPLPLDWDAIAALVKTEIREPSLDLTRDPTGNTILPGQPGRSLDVEAAKAMVEAANGPIVVPVKSVAPLMSDAEYQSMIFRDILGTAYSTFNASNKDRTTNVKLAANFCNDTVLLPGQVFSYNDVVGPRTEERGFKKASVYVGDTVQNGLGGGICQVTSTLYLATLYSDLEIVERYNHSRDVPYVPDGLDATVVYGSKDFKFKNNGEFPIRIQMIVRNNKLTVNVYGTQTVPGKQVKMEVVELSRDPAKLKEVLDTSMAPGTYRISGSVYDGYKSQSYRVVYINGVEYSRTEEAISKYTRYDYTATKYYNPAPAGPETPQPGTGGGVAEGGNEPDPA